MCCGVGRIIGFVCIFSNMFVRVFIGFFLVYYIDVCDIFMESFIILICVYEDNCNVYVIN